MTKQELTQKQAKSTALRIAAEKLLADSVESAWWEFGFHAYNELGEWLGNVGFDTGTLDWWYSYSHDTDGKLYRVEV